MSRPVALIGSGGHAKVLLAALRCLHWTVSGIVDTRPGQGADMALGLPVLGDDAWLLSRGADFAGLVNGIAGASLPALRELVYRRFTEAGFRFPSLLHPNSFVDENVSLGQGAQVMAGAIIQPGATIGDNSIINTGSVIDHDCRIGCHTHVAPGCTLSGDVNVGDGTLVGVGTTVRQGIRIGTKCIIGAGSVVISDIPDGSKAFGIPAKVIST